MSFNKSIMSNYSIAVNRKSSLLDIASLLAITSLLAMAIIYGIHQNRKHTFSTQPSAISKEWLRTVQKNLFERKFNLTWQNQTLLPDNSGAWIAPSQYHQYRSYFTNEGLQIISAIKPGSTEDTWHVAMHLLAAKTGGKNLKLGKAKVKVDGNRIEYHRGPIIEWYRNKKEGLEQGFTLLKSVTNNTRTVDLQIQIKGDLKIKYGDNGNIEFISQNGRHIFDYSHLTAIDANGKKLDSKMQFENQILSLIVDVELATYPIVIDPLIAPGTGTIKDDCLNPEIWCTQLEPSRNYTLGSSVSSAGDINGDGFTDVIIGDPQYSNSPPDGTIHFVGRAYIFFGAASGLSTTPGIVIEPPAVALNANMESNFGAEVKNLGDVNGDAIDDIGIGAYTYDTELTNLSFTEQGRIFVYYGTGFGTLGLNSTYNVIDNGLSIPAVNVSDWSAQIDIPYARFGQSIAGVDVNGDNINDILVGAPNYISATTTTPDYSQCSPDIIIINPIGVTCDAGAVFLYLGQSPGLVQAAQPDWSVHGLLSQLLVGTSVANAGDVNGDSVDDVLIGAPYYEDASGGNAGRALVYFGKGNNLLLSTTPGTDGQISIEPDWSAGPDFNSSYFGVSVSSAGDVNNDNIADIIVGAPWENSTGGFDYNGATYIYHGAAPNGPSAIANTKLTISKIASEFGMTVAGVGDVNGDGFDDVVVGAYDYNVVTGNSWEGAAFLYEGSQTGISQTYSWMRESQVDFSFFTSSIAGVGDLNGDGNGDVLIGARNLNWPGGAALLYNGISNDDLSLTFTGPANFEPANSPTPSFDYTLTLSNSGPAVANNVLINVGVSPQVVNVTSNAPASWSCVFDQPNLAFVCPDPNIADPNITLDSSAPVPITLTITSNVGVITSSAQISSSVLETNLANNSASIVTLINTPPRAATNLTYTIAEDDTSTLTNIPFPVCDPDTLIGTDCVTTANDNILVTIDATEPTTLGIVTNNNNGTFSYTPNPNLFGSDSFTFEGTETISGTAGLVPISSGPISITIIITPENDAPIATQSLQFSATTGNQLSNSLTATDIDSTALTYSLNFSAPDQPTLGTVAIIDPNTGSFTYTPLNIGTGVDRFTFNVTDNGTPPLSDTSVVTINVSSGTNNTPPLITPNQTLSLNEDIITSSTLLATDTETPNSLFYELVTDAIHGSVSITNTATGAYTYTPAQNYFGSDVFTFKVTDGDPTQSLSSTGMVAITITTVNDPPTANSVTLTVVEDSLNNQQALLGSDVDVADNITYDRGQGSEGPKLGSVSIINDTMSYTPNPDAFGTDTFKYVVTDSGVPPLSVKGDVSVTITAVNDSPNLVTPITTSSVIEDGSVEIMLTATDKDSTTLNFTLDANTPPANGTLSTIFPFSTTADPQLTTTVRIIYTPSPDFNGSDTFGYIVTDNATPGAQVSGTVNINITAQSDPPQALDTAVFTVPEDSLTGIDIQLSATDADLGMPNDTLTFYISDGLDGTKAPQKGQLSIVSPAITSATQNAVFHYVPNPSEFGLDTFNFRVVDQGGVESSAVVNVNITPVNDPPIISSSIPTQNVPADVAVILEFGKYVSDVDSTALTYYFGGQQSGSISTSNGATVTILDNTIGSFQYQPAATYIGTDSFNIVVIDDQNAQSNTIAISLNVSDSQGGPIASNVSLNIDEDTPTFSQVSAVDPNGAADINNYAIVDNTTLGELVLESTTGNFSYTPNENINGEDSFTYRVTDQAGNISNTATVTISIAAVNDAPIGENSISVGLSENGGTGIILANDVDNDALSFIQDINYTQGPLYGNVTISTNTAANNGSFEYIPSVAGQLQDDSFGFKVNDGNGGSYNGIVYVSNGDALPSQPILRLPQTDSLVNFADVKFLWVRSKDNNNLPMEYSLFFCENIQPSSCPGRLVPKEYVDRTITASSAIITIGGSSAGFLFFGLVGSASRRKRLTHFLMIMALTISLFACNSGLDEAIPKPIIDLPENLIEYPIGTLQPGTTYYWMVRATVTSTGKSRDSAVRKFTTTSL